MCGICGKVGRPGEPAERDTLQRMMDTLAHRGPDAEGMWLDANVGLGQRRLSVIDLSEAATPPLCNEDRSLWIVFNGEIYNFGNLRRDLENRGHQFATHSDTEVILHLYEERGAECVTALQGMFAFAIWNTRTKTLFAARDRVGKKPFYYANLGGALIFGSEIKAIAADPSVQLEPNLQAIAEYLTWQYVPSPMSAFIGIRKLPAAHHLTFDSTGTLSVERYWFPPVADRRTSSAEDLRDELAELLRSAVRDRMVADVPVGALLSGGIDSGLVTAIMAEEADRPVETFTIGSSDPRYDERPLARKVAERYGTRHHESLLSSEVVREIPALVRHYNEPFADYSALPTFQLARETRKYVTVALGGDGGDEAFSGYPAYGKAISWGAADVVPAFCRRGIGAGLRKAAPWMWHIRTESRMTEASAVLAGDTLVRYLRQVQCFKEAERRAMYTRDLQMHATDGIGSRVAAIRRLIRGDGFDQLMAHDLSYFLPDCLLVKMDVASMAYGLEVRSPLLDHRILEFAATVPLYLRRANSVGKVILRRIAQKLLPPELVDAPKRGFSIPLGAWFRTELNAWLRESLLDGGPSMRRLIRRDFLEKLIADHSSGRYDWTHRLWALLMLEYWFREYFDSGFTVDDCESSKQVSSVSCA